jgi:ABC-type nitrate/sulfonate/bicarbonate transport system permease component
MMRPRLTRMAVYLSAIATQIILWQLLAGKVAGGDVIPPPLDVLQAVGTGFPSLVVACGVTLHEAAIGFALGVGAGSLLGLVSVLADPVERTVSRISVVLTSVPIIALAPVLVIAFGSGLLSNVLLSALACFYTSLITFLLGLRGPSAQHVALFRVYEASQLDVLVRLRIPSALPSFVVACKLAAPAAILGAILGEWSGADSGLGVLMLSELRNYQVDDLWATVLVTTGVSALCYGLFALLERPVTRWMS